MRVHVSRLYDSDKIVIFCYVVFVCLFFTFMLTFLLLIKHFSSTTFFSFIVLSCLSFYDSVHAWDQSKIFNVIHFLHYLSIQPDHVLLSPLHSIPSPKPSPYYVVIDHQVFSSNKQFFYKSFSFSTIKTVI